MTGPAACLFIHGFGGAPFEMLPLSAAFAQRGYSVCVPTLPGHDDTFEAFAASRWDHWLDAMRLRYEALLAEHGRVVVVGQSMGGSLALRLAQLYRPAGVVLVSTPVFLCSLRHMAFSDWRLPFLMIDQCCRYRPGWFQ